MSHTPLFIINVHLLSTDIKPGVMWWLGGAIIARLVRHMKRIEKVEITIICHGLSRSVTLSP